MTTQSNESDDFNPQKVFKKLSDILEQPEKFAQIFCDAASKQKSIDEILNKNIKYLLQTDYETRNSIKDLVHEVEKDNLKFWWKKIGMWTLSAIIFLTGSISTVIIEKVFHK